MQRMRGILEALREGLIKFSNFGMWAEREEKQGKLKTSSLDAWRNEDSFTEIRNGGQKAGFQENGKDFHFQHAGFKVLSQLTFENLLINGTKYPHTQT